MTIAEFLTARYDEFMEWLDEVRAEYGDAMSENLERKFDQAARDIAAKRRIVTWCSQRHMVDIRTVGDLARDPHPNDFVPGELRNPFDAVVLRFMAEVYADHPDYDPRWRP